MRNESYVKFFMSCFLIDICKLSIAMLASVSKEPKTSKQPIPDQNWLKTAIIFAKANLQD